MIDYVEIPTDGDRPNARDILEVVWLPALFALFTAAATWLIWYYTHAVCSPEIAALTGCNQGVPAKYVNVDVFGRMVTYGGLVGGIGGLWRYDMIKKERAARIAAQNRLAELQKEWEEERRGFREALAEARRLAEEQAAEERRLAAQDRQAFLAALTELTAEIAHMRRQRNGDAHNGQ